MSSRKKQRIHQCFAVVAPGFEEVCRKELHRLGISGEASRGGVCFEGGLEQLYRANLWLRSPGRILVRVGEFSCRDFPDLYRKTFKLPWGRYLKGESSVEVRVRSARSRLWHSDRVAQTVREGVARSLGVDSVGAGGGRTQTLHVRLEEDRCQLSIDSSGELLHRRGYRTDIGPAPLRETLAAAILLQLGWDGSEPLVDPMCGSGTFLAEGALIASGRSPGLNRAFAFMDWPGYRPGLWEDLCRQTQQACRPPGIDLLGYDRDAAVIEAARRNLGRLGMEDAVTLSVRSLEKQARHGGRGLVLCNPPYGERLEERRDVESIFGDLGDCYRRHFPGWRGAFLSPSDQLAASSGLDFRPEVRFRNGGLAITLYAGKIPHV